MSGIRRLFYCCFAGSPPLRLLTKKATAPPAENNQEKPTQPEWKNFADRGTPDGKTSSDNLAPSEKAMDQDTVPDGNHAVSASLLVDPNNMDELPSAEVGDIDREVNCGEEDSEAAKAMDFSMLHDIEEESKIEATGEVIYQNRPDSDHDDNGLKESDWSLLPPDFETKLQSVSHPSESESKPEAAEKPDVVYLNMSSTEATEPETSERRTSSTTTMTFSLKPKTPTTSPLSDNEQSPFSSSNRRSSKSGRSLFQIKHKPGNAPDVQESAPIAEGKVLLVESKASSSSSSSSSSSDEEQ